MNVDNPVVHDQIIDLVFKEDELSWQSMLLDLVEQERMDPWNIDVSVLSRKFLDLLIKMKELDFRITGKVVLAAALLLKLKSDRLMDEDLAALDDLINGTEENQFFDDVFDGMIPFAENEYETMPKIVPKTPQPRKRKISVYDLVEALEKALEVEGRRKNFEKIPEVKVPEKKKDISEIMDEIYSQVKKHYKKNKHKKSLSFSQLVPSENKEDKVYTFIPLLHLENARKVEMFQQQSFGEINIDMI